MPDACRARKPGRLSLACRASICIGLTAFLGLQIAGGPVLAQSAVALASLPKRPVLPLRFGALDSRPIACRIPGEASLARSTASLFPAFLAVEVDTSRAAAAPFYKKTWFLAGVAGLVAATAVVLARGGGDEEKPGERAGLPGFPPPPSGR